MEANIELAQSLFKQNKYQETIDTCKKILATDSNSLEAIKLIAESFLATRKIDDARLYFNKALTLKPDDYEVIKDLGNTYQAIGDLKTAKNFYLKSIAINSSYAPALSNLGSLEITAGNKQEGLSLLIKATEYDPQLAPAWGNLVTGYVQLGKTQEAEIACHKAIEINPNLFNSHFLLGTILVGQKKVQEAEEPFRKTIELNPGFFQAHLNLGAVLKDLGKIKEAEISTRKAIELKPDFAMGHYLLSLIYIEEKLFNKAYQEINLAIKYDSKNHIYQGELTRIKFIMGKYDEQESETNALWSDNDDYFFEDNNSDILLISFGSMGRPQKLIPSFDFYNLLKNEKSFDKLFLRDMDRNYYLTGLKNSTDSLQDTINLVKKLSSVKRYKKKVSIGSSAGGFAAILFGHLLNFSKVIAFNPQTVISEEKETIINDTFYTVNVCKKLRKLNRSNTLYQNCLSLKNLIPFKTKVEIHFSNLSEIDKNHANFIEHKNCELIKHNSSSHLLAIQLRDSKDLKGIIKESLEI